MRGLPIILLLLPALAFAHEGAHEGSVTEIEREGNRLGYAARVPVPLLAEWLDLDADDDLQRARRWDWPVAQRQRVDAVALFEARDSRRARGPHV